MITWNELVSASVAPIPKELESTAKEFLELLNKFRLECNIPMIPTSFYRTMEHEKNMGRSGKSDHTKCLACDFRDRDKRLANWVKDNEHIVTSLGLYVEDPAYTSTWLHLTSVRKSKTVFKPY